MPILVELRDPSRESEPEHFTPWHSSSSHPGDDFASSMNLPFTPTGNSLWTTFHGGPDSSSTAEPPPPSTKTSAAAETHETTSGSLGSSPSYHATPASPTFAASSTPHPSPAATATQNEDSSRSQKVKTIAAVVVPMMFMAFLGLVLYLYIRKRRRQKRQGLVQQEMKSRSPTSYTPTGSQAAYYHRAPVAPPPPAVVSIAPPPVILGPIAPISGGGYYTGIDTSDVVSVHEPPTEGNGLGNPFLDPHHEEPPPPYRPRSLGPPSRGPSVLSRNASSRGPAPAALSQTNLIAAQEQSRSPFRDPHDDDNISEFSEPTGPHHFRSRAVDEMSAVSDLSYQQDPVISRPAV